MRTCKGGDGMQQKIKEVLKGNSEAFGDIIKEYEKNIYNYLYRLCGSREDALDLTQITFLKAYNGLGSLKAGGDFKPWLYRIAHNSFIDYLRSRKEFDSLQEDALSDGISLEDLVISRDMAKVIDDIIESLPHEYKSVFLLRAMEDLSYSDISSILKISVSTARARYLRARRKIAFTLNGGDLL
jgi:RNA polymerase sigma-70 factor (ECF subfamily)